MNDHERGFLTFLVDPTKRRMQTLLELGEKRRRDVRMLLDHSVHASVHNHFSQERDLVSREE